MDIKGLLQEQVPLAEFTSFEIGGPVEYFAEARSPHELARLVNWAEAEGQPLRILGGGTNILAADGGVRGLVVRLSGPEFTRVEWHAETRLSCGAASILPALVKAAARQGLSGLEALAGIPGTVGGALRMNSGGRYGNISDCVSAVEVLAESRPAGPQASSRRERLPRESLTFSYRASSLAGRMVLAAEFELRRSERVSVENRVRGILQEKEAAQPLARRSAGCVFKNPPGLSAGKLLEELGAKGMRRGAAQVSELHANFIVNLGGALASDVLALIEELRRRAREARGIELELEIELWE